MKTLATINLSDNQKRVMAKILAAPTPKVALDSISKNQSLIAARDQLAKIGMVSLNPNGASVTDKGTKVMQDEALVDEGGQLTPDGEQLAHTDVDGKPEQDKAASPTPTDMMGQPEQQPQAPAPGTPPPQSQPDQLQLQSVNWERFKLLRELLKG